MNITTERKFIISGIFLLVGFIFIARLFFIQVIDETYKLSANNNVLRYMTEYPSRGLIYDRKGRLMVYNEAVYDLMMVHKQVKNLDTAEFCRLIGIPKQDFMKKIRKIKKTKDYSPVKLSRRNCISSRASIASPEQYGSTPRQAQRMFWDTLARSTKKSPRQIRTTNPVIISASAE
jgi:penicillin-binding protein 2